MNFDKHMARVRKIKRKLAERYETDESKVVWMGDDRYTVITSEASYVVADNGFVRQEEILKFIRQKWNKNTRTIVEKII